jgi:hypothetical protein
MHPRSISASSIQNDLVTRTDRYLATRHAARSSGSTVHDPNVMSIHDALYSPDQRRSRT